MKRRVHVELRALSQVDAQAHAAAIDTALVGKTLHATDVATRSENDSRVGWVARGQFRFASAADADSLYATLVSRLSLALSLAGSEVHWHDCSHDEASPQPCVIGGRSVK